MGEQTRAQRERAKVLAFEAVGELTPTVGVKKFMGGVSRSWVHRRLKTDPSFPRPIKFGGKGSPMWRVTDLRSYIERAAS